MKKYLIVVDMQNDFVDGALGTKEAQEIIPKVVDKIESFDGTIFVTYDTHYMDYLETAEGKVLPISHCIYNTKGWELNKQVAKVLYKKGFNSIMKHTFGAICLPELITNHIISYTKNIDDKDFINTETGEGISIEIIGLCTDICVISNALILKANFPEANINVIEQCCAGVTPEKHKAAIEVMRSCQINTI